MSVIEGCSSYKESNKGNKQRQGPTLGVRFTEVSVKRESTVLSFLLLSFFFYFFFCANVLCSCVWCAVPDPLI